MIKSVHLDDRLIHGQVAISWTRSLGINVLLVVNDQRVNDQMRRNALKIGVPAGVKFGFRSVEEGIKFLNSPDSEKYKIMVLINNAIDAEKVMLGISGVNELTIGGVRKNAPYITDNLNLDNDEPYYELYNRIIKHFEENPDDGCYVCLCKKGFYHSVPSGFPPGPRLQ